MEEVTLEPRETGLYLGRSREEIGSIFEEAGAISQQRLEAATTLGDFLRHHMIASFAETRRDIALDKRWLGAKQVSVDSITTAQSFQDLSKQNAVVVSDLAEKLLTYEPRNPEKNIIAVIRRVAGDTEEGEYRVLALFPPWSVVTNEVNEEVFGMTQQPAIVFYQPIRGCRKKICELILGNKKEDILELPYQDVYGDFKSLGLASKLAFALSGGFREHEWLHCRISDFDQLREIFKTSKSGVMEY